MIKAGVCPLPKREINYLFIFDLINKIFQKFLAPQPPTRRKKKRKTLSTKGQKVELIPDSQNCNPTPFIKVTPDAHAEKCGNGKQAAFTNDAGRIPKTITSIILFLLI